MELLNNKQHNGVGSTTRRNRTKEEGVLVVAEEAAAAKDPTTVATTPRPSALTDPSSSIRFLNFYFIFFQFNS